MHRLVGVLGMITMMAVAYLFSTNRRAIRYKTVAWGLGLQIVFAFLVMRWQYGRLIFQKAGAAVNWVPEEPLGKAPGGRTGAVCSARATCGT